MSTLGQKPATQHVSTEKQTITGNGGTSYGTAIAGGTGGPAGGSSSAGTRGSGGGGGGAEPVSSASNGGAGEIEYRFLRIV